MGLVKQVLYECRATGYINSTHFKVGEVVSLTEIRMVVGKGSYHMFMNRTGNMFTLPTEKFLKLFKFDSKA